MPNERTEADLKELLASLSDGERDGGEAARRVARRWCRDRGRRCTMENLEHSLGEMILELETRGFIARSGPENEP